MAEKAAAPRTSLVDPVALAVALVRCPSVTPEDGGALDVLEDALSGLGFACHRLPFESAGGGRVENLFARLGGGPPHFCFAGHTDVVPVGERRRWSADPFAGHISDGRLMGRGAADMKGAISCFVAAVSRLIGESAHPLSGSVSLLVTGDEEGPAINGTRRVLDWMAHEGQIPDVCLVGEPTNPGRLGEMVKIGRRGSLNGRLTVHGAGGHVAYPHLADNPVPRLLAVLSTLARERLDEGTAHFEPSNLEITSVDVGNAATNVIPASAEARWNIRFNDLHTGAALSRRLEEICAEHAGRHDLAIEISGEAFLTEPGPFTDLLSGAIEEVTGIVPELSTSGGTSDARFIKDYCPVAEFGLLSQTMHKVDECAALDDIARLTEIYRLVLERYLSA